MPREIDTTALAQRAWEDGKRVLAPRVDWDAGRLGAVQIESFKEPDIRTGERGIAEPAGPEVKIDEIDLVVVPGLAFDVRGNRLGRGGGFYDRFLAQPGFRAVRCGLAFEIQIVECVPVNAFDVSMHMLVTDAAVRRFTDTTAA